MAQWPCSNPNCASHGKPHPNCRCAAPMAQGGEANFCSTNQAHEPGCEYYAGGGEVRVPMNTDNIKTALQAAFGAEPGEIFKWIFGVEDKQAAVAGALFYSGALSLLKGTMNGVYDQNSGIQGLANDKIAKRISQYLITQSVAPQVFAKKLVGDRTGKMAIPIMLRMLSNGQAEGFNNLLSYAQNASRGEKLIDGMIDGLFDNSKYKKDESVALEEVEKLDKFIKNNSLGEQLQPMGYDEKSIFSGIEPMSNNFPDHQMLLSSAKSRINNYLSSLRPEQLPSILPFDSAYPDEEKQRFYQKALRLAIDPKKIIDHIKIGDLTTDDMNQFKSLYPEVYEFLSRKLTERIVQAQVNGEKPAYQERQAMSLFLGAELDSTFLPMSIQAAQMTFAGQSAQKEHLDQQQGKPKKSSNSLNKMPKQFRTQDQAAETRAQSEK